tara:strand:- start:200 stop:517 length:318 start_codon:yes stop_codon:yes gene_type:complete
VSLNEHIWLVWNFCVIIGYIINCYFYFYYYGVDQVSNKREKLRNQLKSNMYYIFWGACTLAVMTGQIYVGVGYNRMSQSVNDLTEMIEIKIELEELRKRQGGILY